MSESTREYGVEDWQRRVWIARDNGEQVLIDSPCPRCMGTLNRLLVTVRQCFCPDNTWDSLLSVSLHGLGNTGGWGYENFFGDDIVE